MEPRVIDSVPLIAPSPRVAAPDLVMRWNASTPAAAQVDVVVHFHGHPASALDAGAARLRTSGLDFADPSGRDAAPGRAAPTLCLLPRGTAVDGRRMPGGGAALNLDASGFPALASKEGLDALVDAALRDLAGALGQATPKRRGRLIVTAHARGGAALLHLLHSTDPDELHIFDALTDHPRTGALAGLVAWLRRRTRDPALRARSALRIIYRPAATPARLETQTASLFVDQEIARAPLDLRQKRYFCVQPTEVAHEMVAAAYGWRLLADAAAPLSPTGGLVS
jgi:hypothetical protein